MHGTLTVHDDEKFVRALVGRPTRTHEALAALEGLAGQAGVHAEPALLQAMRQTLV